MWPEWHVEALLGQGSFGKVYRAVRSGHGHTSRAAIKVIEIPQDPGEAWDLVSSGMDEASVRGYFEHRAQDVLGEVALMEELKGAPNVVGVEDYQLVERGDGVGWIVLVRMPLLEPIRDYFERVGKPKPMEVARLGVDVCRALSACHAKGVIYRDVKPENIFRGEYGYLLGDFGIVRHLQPGAGSAHTRAGAYPYMAPEVFAGRGYGPSVDTYSLGLVLYRFLNNGRGPFLPTEGVFTPADSERAVALRLAGRVLPAPAGADEALGSIVLRAVNPDPARRFGSADEMGTALNAWASGKATGPAERPGPVRPAASAPRSPIFEDAAPSVGQAPFGPTGTMRADVQMPVSQGAPQSASANVSADASGYVATPRAQQAPQPYEQQQLADVNGADRGSSGDSHGKTWLIIAAAIVAAVLLALPLFGSGAGCGSSSSSSNPTDSGGTTVATENGSGADGSFDSASGRWDSTRSGALAGNMLIDDDICTVEVTSMYKFSSDDDLYFHVTVTNHTEDDLSIWSPDEIWTVNGWETECVFAIDCAAGETNDSDIFYLKGDSLPAQFPSTEEIKDVTGALVVSPSSEEVPYYSIHYDVSFSGDDVPSNDAKTAPETASSQGAEGAASYDNLSGRYVTTGTPAGGYLTAATLTDSRLILIGDIRAMTDSGEGESVGDKMWVFNVNEDSEFGYSADGNFIEQPREEFAETLESLSFPALSLNIEDGTIVRATIHA